MDLLVALVTVEEVGLVVGQPALVGVARSLVPEPRQRHRVLFVGHVHDGDVVELGVGGVGDAVRVEADLLAVVLGVRPLVHHALGVVDVVVVVEAARERRVLGLVDVDHVQTGAAQRWRVVGEHPAAGRQGVDERSPVDVADHDRRDGHVAGATHADRAARRVVDDHQRGRAGSLCELGLDGEATHAAVGHRDVAGREPLERATRQRRVGAGRVLVGCGGHELEVAAGALLGRRRPEGRTVGQVGRGAVVAGDLDAVGQVLARVRTGTDRVEETGVLVDEDVVRRAVAGVAGVGLVVLVAAVPVPQAGQVEDLHTVVGVLGHDVGVVGVDLDVTPVLAAEERRGLHDPEHTRLHRVGDVDEHRAVAGTDQGVVLAGLGVGPSPDVVEELGAELTVRDVAEQLDVLAVEVARRPAVLAGRVGRTDLAATGRLERVRGGTHRRCQLRGGPVARQLRLGTGELVGAVVAG